MHLVGLKERVVQRVAPGHVDDDAHDGKLPGDAAEDGGVREDALLEERVVARAHVPDMPDLHAGDHTSRACVRQLLWAILHPLQVLQPLTTPPPTPACR